MDRLGWVLLIAANAAVAWRRARPVHVAWFVLGVTVPFWVLDYAADDACGMSLLVTASRPWPRPNDRDPKCVLMDIRMPELDGVEAKGATGFLLKDTPPEQLIEAVRVVAAGEALLSPSVTRKLVEEFARSAPPRAGAPGLDDVTERETEVLVAMAPGVVERRDRCQPLRRRDDGEDPCRSSAHEARGP